MTVILCYPSSPQRSECRVESDKLWRGSPVMAYNLAPVRAVPGSFNQQTSESSTVPRERENR